LTTTSAGGVGTDFLELERFLNLLPFTPVMVKLNRHRKDPDVPKDTSLQDPQNQLSPQQAFERLQQGGNVGIMATGHDLVIFDHDDPNRYTFAKETLTVKTSSGKLHKYYLNNPTDPCVNATGKNGFAGCGEVRACNWYVVAPGSYVPLNPAKPNTYNGTGHYTILETNPIAELCRGEIPQDFVPTGQSQTKTTTTFEPPQEKVTANITIRNGKGQSLTDLCALDPDLNRLLNGDDSKYAFDTSSADMATMTLLYHTYQFDEPTIYAIMTKHRYRTKLDRPDYLQRTLQTIKQKPPITNKLKNSLNPPPTSQQQTLTPNSPSNENTQTTIVQKINNKQIDYEKILTALKQEYTFKTPTDTLELHYYQDGIYAPAERMIESLLETVLQQKLTSHYAKEIIDHLKRDSYVKRNEINKFVDVIPVKNGLLNLKTWQLDEFTPKNMFTYKLPLTYDATAECPLFKQWLSEVQTPENILILQEYAGYTLLPEMPHHKALFMVGDGSNGKSTYLSTIENLIGTENICHNDLQELNSENRFIKADFYGKLANISNEPETKKLFETPIFKQLTGGDMIRAELKNVQKPLNFVNYAKFYFSGNNYPRVSDSSTGFKRRLILLKWEKQFLEGQGEVVQFYKRWTESEVERSGILNWMLEGLKRLKLNGRFTVSLSQEQNRLEYERNSDSVAAWVHERVKKSKTGQVEQARVWEDYCVYCDFYGVFQVDENKLKYSLSRKHGLVNKRTNTAQGKVLVWCGIQLKQPLVEGEEQNNSPQQTLQLNKPVEKTNEIPQFLEKDGMDNMDTLFPTQNNCNEIISSGKMPVHPVHPVQNENCVEYEDNTPVYEFKRLKPGVKCRFCELHAVEFEWNLKGNFEVFRSCPECFKKQRRQFDCGRWVDVTSQDSGNNGGT